MSNEKKNRIGISVAEVPFVVVVVVVVVFFFPLKTIIKQKINQLISAAVVVKC